MHVVLRTYILMSAVTQEKAFHVVPIKSYFRFSGNSEASVLVLLENSEEMFVRYL